MLLRHNPQSFLTGETPFLPTISEEEREAAVTQRLTFDTHHEGFIGIPHGGISMGLCADAWLRSGLPTYPVSMHFKFGGSGIAIGDTAMFTVERSAGQNGGIVATVTKAGDRKPYVRGEIVPGQGASGNHPQQPSAASRELPYYRNCFVCGHHREIPGLQRRFRVHPDDTIPAISVAWNQTDDDRDRAALFRVNRTELHPAVLLSIFDENSAWGGFMQTKAGALSVRLSFTQLRPVNVHEQLLFVSRPSGIRGNRASPRFFLADGAVLAMNGDSSGELVGYGGGEWILMAKYTEQIKSNLLPKDAWEWIFR